LVGDDRGSGDVELAAQVGHTDIGPRPVRRAPDRKGSVRLR
jgi:hypothetical protein